MTKVHVEKAASDWNHDIALSLGIAFEPVASFKDFFGIDPPDDFGNGLRQDFHNRVYNCVKSVCDIGLIGKDSITEAFNAKPFYDSVLNFFQAEKNVSTNYPYQESAVDEFGKAVLHLVGFNLVPGVNIHGPIPLRTKIASVSVAANPDIIVERRDLKKILIVQEDKTFYSSRNWRDGASQLMAEALAAYDSNVKEGSPDDHTIYGILLRGVIPIFFKIPMNGSNVQRIKKTKYEIDDILITGEYYCPHDEMNDVTYLTRRPQNLREFLQCFEAMRRITVDVS